MRKEKVIRFICDMLIVIFLLGVAFALLWYLHGSFEMIPSEEKGVNYLCSGERGKAWRISFPGQNYW